MPAPTKREADRRATIRELISSKVVGTQEELRQLLVERGFEVTQATLSRDLGRIGARRVQLDEGGTAYELPERPVPQAAALELAGFRDMVTRVAANDSLVVVQTITGAASTVAVAIDRARLPEALATLAGDDTIFVAPVRGTPPGRLMRRLTEHWEKGDES